MAGNPTLPVHQTREGSGTHGKNSGKGRATRLLLVELIQGSSGFGAVNDVFALRRAKSRLL